MGDASETSDETNQCIALTGDGERCSRTARDGEFCYQHDESDETINEAMAADGGAQAESGSQSESEESDGDTEESESGDEQSQTDSEEEAESEDEADADDENETETEDEAESESEEESQVDTVNELEEAAGGIEESDESEESDDGSVDILEVRKLVETTASDLIGRELDGISEIRAEEDGWLVVVDLIERPAVPDSQDILGSYEIELGTGGSIQGYRRINRYRRSDTADVE